MITSSLGGRAAEELFLGDVTTGASDDFKRSTNLARSMVTEYGMSDLGPIQYERNNGSVFLGRDYMDTTKNFSTQVAFEIDKAVREIVETAHEEAKHILTEHSKDVTLIAETLLAKETITAEEIESLIKTGALPKKEVASVNETALLTKEEKEVFEGKEALPSAESETKKDPEPPSKDETK